MSTIIYFGLYRLFVSFVITVSSVLLVVNLFPINHSLTITYITREFMSQLVKQGFDPSYGFFKTTSEQLLYPNPDVGVVHQDYLKHLHFLGT